MKTKTLAALLASVPLAISGCRDVSKDMVKTGEYEGHPATICIDGSGRSINIKEEPLHNSGYIFAIDYENDGSFDEIRISRGDDIRKLSPSFRENYLSTAALEKAYQFVNEHGHYGW